MDTSNKILLTFLASIGGLGASLVSWAEGWHAWPVPVALAACIDLLLFARIRSGSTPGQSAPFDSSAPHLAGPHRENPANDVRLPSSASEYDFLFSAIVRWRPTGAVPGSREHANANPGSQAVNAIIERARAAAAMERPESYREAQNRLATALGAAEPDPTGRVEAWATNVSLTLAPDDLERVSKLADLRKEADLWARRRAFERERRSYLGEDVFKNTGSAVMWMLAQNEHSEQDVERAVRLIGPLALLSSAANEKPVPEFYRHLIEPIEPATPGTDRTPDGAHNAGSFEKLERTETLLDHIASVIRDFAADSDSERSATFARRMAKTFEKCEQPETARKIRENFGLREPAPASSSSAAADSPFPSSASGSRPPFDESPADAKLPAARFAPDPGSGSQHDLPEDDADDDSTDGWGLWDGEDQQRDALES